MGFRSFPVPSGREIVDGTEVRKFRPIRIRQLEVANDWLHSGGSVLFYGPAGFGASAVLDEVVAVTAGQYRVLRCSEPPATPQRPLRSLASLLSCVKAEELDNLPEEHRRVLTESASGRIEDRLHANSAVVRAMLMLVRLLTGSGPLLLVIDQVERLDRDSSNVLRFVATHVDGLAVQMVAAEEMRMTFPPVGHRLCPPPLLMVALDA
jgi:hypothetical protein